MQENNISPIANSPQTTETHQVPTSNDQQPKTNSFLVILLSILLVISVSIAGYFAYQTQKLVKELQVMSDESKQTVQNATELAAEPLATVDPTAGWKIYDDKDWGFLIKYPSDFVFVEKKVNANYVVFRKPGGEVEGTDAFSHFRITVESDPSISIDKAIETAQSNSLNIFGNDLKFTPIVDIGINTNYGKSYYHSGYGYQQHIFVANTNKNKILHFTVIFANEEVQKNEQSEVNQILSTFKFTN